MPGVSMPEGLPFPSMVPAETVTIRCAASALTPAQIDRLRAIADGRRAFDVLGIELGGVGTRAVITGWRLDGDQITLYAAVGRPRIVTTGERHHPIGVRMPGLSTTFGFEDRAAAYAWLRSNSA